MLIAAPRGQRAERSLPQGEHADAQMLVDAAQLQEQRVLRAAESLQGDTSAVRVRGPSPSIAKLAGVFMDMDT